VVISAGLQTQIRGFESLYCLHFNFLGGSYAKSIEPEKKFSGKFTEQFNFFFSSYRKGILTFCGKHVEVSCDPRGVSGKQGFRLFNNGNKDIITRHPYILKGTIIGKKSWGLHVKEWSLGIAEGNFTKHEILSTFEKKGLKIPKPLQKEFHNAVYKRRQLYFKRE
jgi:hypothetical protein